MLPSIKQMRKQVSRHRSRDNIKSDAYLSQFEDFFFSFNAEKLLQENTENYIIMLNNENLGYFRSSETWLIDGTFKSCPIGYAQLLIVSFIVFDKPFSGCYILMKNKTAGLYEEVFKRCLVISYKNIFV